MGLSLFSELKALVKHKVASVNDRDQADVVGHALRLLERQDKIVALNAELDDGEADLGQGGSATVRTKADLDALFRSR
jgi:hypothetical protein